MHVSVGGWKNIWAARQLSGRVSEACTHCLLLACLRNAVWQCRTVGLMATLPKITFTYLAQAELCRHYQDWAFAAAFFPDSLGFEPQRLIILLSLDTALTWISGLEFTFNFCKGHGTDFGIWAQVYHLQPPYEARNRFRYPGYSLPSATFLRDTSLTWTSESHFPISSFPNRHRIDFGIQVIVYLHLS